MDAPAPDPQPTVFGPVPSRRLGRSLGLNNVPAKTCDYGCVYCQVGITRTPRAEREAYYSPWAIVQAAGERVAQLDARGEALDALTFVPSGEPTLDANLGREIRELAAFGVTIAVITNGSLVHRPDVQAELSGASWVSLKVDAMDPRIWRRINRPHAALDLATILTGLQEFAARFPGTLVTETMLVRDLNDDPAHLRDLAAFVATLAPAVAYLSVPTRPPSRDGVRGPGPAGLNRAYEIFAGCVPRVELLIGYEGDAFSATGDAALDLLNITSVHPLRTAAVVRLLERDGAGWDVVDGLLARGELDTARHAGHTYYLRRARREPAPDLIGRSLP